MSLENVPVETGAARVDLYYQSSDAQRHGSGARSKGATVRILAIQALMGD